MKERIAIPTNSHPYMVSFSSIGWLLIIFTTGDVFFT